MASASAATPAPPQVLLGHHLRQPKLPTFLREHEKLAAEAAREGLDHVPFLLRLAELELIDRERRVDALSGTDGSGVPRHERTDH
jgi:hypothetical protein